MNQHDTLIDTMTEVARAVAQTSAPAGLAVMNMLTTAADALRDTASPEKIQALIARRGEIQSVSDAHARRPGAAFLIEP